MTRHEFIWVQIDRLRDSLLPGAHITCSVLGRIKPERTRSGYVGQIPASLQSIAFQHGLKVIGADYTSDIYTLEVLPKMKEEWR